MKAAIYCRVSTYDQTKGELTSTQVQEDKLRKYCDLKDWEVVKVYTDDGKSAATLNRPEFQQLLFDAKRKKFSVLLATRFDRISRNNRDWFNLISQFEELNVDIVTLSPELDTTTTPGRLVRDILIILAQFERELVQERTIEKMYAAAQKGLWTGGYPPQGYKMQDSKLKIIKKDAEIIRQIFNKYVEGMKPAQIAHMLNNKGIRTPERKMKTGRIVGNKKYNPNIISRILSTPTYAGFVRFNDELFKGIQKPIISKKMWDESKNISKAKQISPRLGTGKLLLLTGLTRCGYCGSAMTTAYTPKRDKIYFYYRCTNATKHGANQCRGRQISAKTIESYVYELINTLANDSEFVTKTVIHINKNKKKDLLKLKEEYKVIQSNLSNVKKEINNIERLLASGGKGLNSLIKKLQELEERQNQFEAETSKLKLSINGLQEQVFDFDSIKPFFENFSSTFKMISPEDKRRLIGVFIEKIEISIPKDKSEGRIKIKPWNLQTLDLSYEEILSSSFEPTSLPINSIIELFFKPT
ncbi:MAG: recombinase family protein [Candidatus Marinimicrobia bacterium]|nr:recombinase family protein [Candidatus Neomarinimicrobiota bacterium]